MNEQVMTLRSTLRMRLAASSLSAVMLFVFWIMPNEVHPQNLKLMFERSWTAVIDESISNHSMTQRARAEMAALTIDLQNGFADDLVVIRVNDLQVFHRDKITTNVMIGHADSFSVQVPEGLVEVEVLLPGRNQARTMSFKISGVAYLGIFIDDDNIESRISTEPFGYM